MRDDELDGVKRAMEATRRLTVGELRAHLAPFDAEAEVTFGAAYEGRNPLVFRQVKNRGPIEGPGLASIELDEVTDDEVRELLGYGD